MGSAVSALGIHPLHLRHQKLLRKLHRCGKPSFVMIPVARAFDASLFCRRVERAPSRPLGEKPTCPLPLSIKILALCDTQRSTNKWQRLLLSSSLRYGNILRLRNSIIPPLVFVCIRRHIHDPRGTIGPFASPPHIIYWKLYTHPTGVPQTLHVYIMFLVSVSSILSCDHAMFAPRPVSRFNSSSSRLTSELRFSWLQLAAVRSRVLPPVKSLYFSQLSPPFTGGMSSRASQKPTGLTPQQSALLQ